MSVNQDVSGHRVCWCLQTSLVEKASLDPPSEVPKSFSPFKSIFIKALLAIATPHQSHLRQVPSPEWTQRQFSPCDPSLREWRLVWNQGIDLANERWNLKENEVYVFGTVKHSCRSCQGTRAFLLFFILDYGSCCQQLEFARTRIVSVVLDNSASVVCTWPVYNMWTKARCLSWIQTF